MKNAEELWENHQDKIEGYQLMDLFGLRNALAEHDKEIKLLLDDIVRLMEKRDYDAAVQDLCSAIDDLQKPA